MRFSFVFFLLFFSNARLVLAQDHPSWVSKDYKSSTEWGFYCEGEGKSESDALKAAHLQCSQKMCELFGVEVDSQTKSEENLKDISVTSTVVERCPNVRVVGRVEKKKSVECDDGNCHAFVLQLYPKAEYDKEYARLNQPQISKVLEKTIIIRDGKDTFQDPKACLAILDQYSLLKGESDAISKQRISTLESSVKPCANLDYRDTRIQNEIFQKELKSTQDRDISTQVYLGKELSAASTVEARIQVLLTYERAKIGLKDRTEKLKKIMAKQFDAFNTHFGNAPDATFAYVAETKTCASASILISEWPKNLTNDITVCSIADPTKCISLNIIMLRAQWSSCVCRNQKPFQGRESDCTRDLMQSLDSVCTDTVTPKCLEGTAPTFQAKYGGVPYFPK